MGQGTVIAKRSATADIETELAALRCGRQSLLGRFPSSCAHVDFSLFSPEFDAMQLNQLCTRQACIALGCLWATAFFTLPAAANTIDVRLNVDYAIDTDPLSGGTWSLEAKSGGAGINSLSLRLTGISSTSSVAPIGIVNGSTEAGFGIFMELSEDDHQNIVLGQRPSSPETLFYGVGTLLNGSPDYPGKPPGTNSIGPAMPTLTDIVNVPWASDPPDPADMAWDLAATLLTGTFGAGATPAFFSAPGIVSTGTLFTSVGTGSTHGPLSNVDPLTSMIVRTDLVNTMADADYNNDGFVNAADYTVWRNTVGSTSIFDADGSGPSGTPDQVIDMFDYQFWKDHYGETVPGNGAAFGNATVPEPTTAWLLVLGTIFTFAKSRNMSRRARRSERATAQGACEDRKSAKRELPQ
jgi:hypothetical protein